MQRNKLGQFSKRSLLGIVVFLTIIVISMFGGIKWFDVFVEQMKSESKEVIAQMQIAEKERFQSKIEELKMEVLNQLSDCETKGTIEPDAAIILDSNARMSIGRYMFQITTVQYYVKKFEGREITRREAIEIAVDPERSTPLAEQIIFQDGALKNWLICSNRLGLDKQVKIINKLSE